ncbi:MULTISPECIES: DUF4136 domain-containing protein [unclassified Microbulbifer]|uniref:DUF4136 domain-containing protein n=1 Tax=unclassified Microbulbifer TaxID=2619833 RepID=UPI0027E53D01|nr:MULTISPECIES: DUF4136 domain-containing protein [unclassified Microbulbifer]
MRIKLIGLLAVLLLAACETMEVQRVEPRVAPVAFSTYTWGPSALGDVPEVSAQLVELDQEMRDVVAAEMGARGYRLVENGAGADMVVDYQVAVIEEQFAGDPTDSSWDAQFDSNATPGVVELPTRTGAPRVTLTLGIGRPGEPSIWGGTATKLMTRSEDAAERRHILSAAVRDLLKDLPPAAP